MIVCCFFNKNHLGPNLTSLQIRQICVLCRSSSSVLVPAHDDALLLAVLVECCEEADLLVSLRSDIEVHIKMTRAWLYQALCFVSC